MLRYSIVIGWLLLAVCGNAQSPRSQLFNDTSHYVVFTYNSEQHWAFTTGRPTLLDRKERGRLEMLLRQAIKEHNAHTVDKAYQLHRLHRFYFQLVPVLNGANEKEAWVNAHCIYPGSNWRKRIVEVQDGGNCFFSVKINLTRGIAYDLRINGYS